MTSSKAVTSMIILWEQTFLSQLTWWWITMCLWESRGSTLYSMTKMRIAGPSSPAILLRIYRHPCKRKKRRRKKKLTIAWRSLHTMGPLICKSNSGTWTRNALWRVWNGSYTGESLKTVILWCKTIKTITFINSTSTNNSTSTRVKKSKYLLSKQQINSL